LILNKNPGAAEAAGPGAAYVITEAL